MTSKDNNTTTVTDGSTVEVHYRGTLTDGTEFDNSYDRGEPIKFTVGEGPMIPGFVTAITGMAPGETKTVTIPSSEAYGAENPEAVTQIQTVYGRITEQQDSTVTVDLNHPLAGKDLQFEIEMVSVTSVITDSTTAG